MRLEEYKQLFEAALEKAARNIEETYSVALSRNFEIEFHGLGHTGDILDIETTVNKLYQGDDLFFPFVDVGVKYGTPRSTRVYVGVTGHRPVATLEETWNNPPGSGPFKQILSMQFKFVDE